jgi:4-amino-4-deoxy-L-arabinose transferase-like glycosyltransferase
LIAAAFFAVQVCIIWFAANGPFVDEGAYTVAGLRVLEGKGLSDGYLAWFNGSPFVWPVLAAFGHHLGGLPGARLMAALLSLVTLVAFARTAETLFGESAAAWATGALAVNGLFMALAHFAVYDVPGLTGIALSMWCATRRSGARDSMWVTGAAAAFSFAVIAKYGYLFMVVPLAGLLVSVRGFEHAGRALALFLSVAGVLLAAYFLPFFGSLVPSSASAYLEQPFRARRAHIAVLQMVYGLVPSVLAGVGAIIAWRRHQRMLVVTCLAALLLFPVFHLWTANAVSSQKHVVPGFLFAYLLAGVALERWWNSRSRAAVVLGLALLVTWGSFQWYWQERSWSDNRTLASYLAQNMTRGERVVAESAWTYILTLYPSGAIESPSDVIDANHSPTADTLPLCQIPWLVGNAASAARIRSAVDQCGHRRVLSSATEHYYFDTTRLRWDTYTVTVDLYRLPLLQGSSR